MEIKRTGTGGVELEIKRLYLPFEITTKCPECGKKAVRDLDSDYLSYPELGEPESVHFYCDECDHEWEEKVILDVTLKEAK